MRAGLLSRDISETVSIECDRIEDWATFHDVFTEAFGFPDFYGRNVDAWIDCMTSLDDRMSDFQVNKGEMVILNLVDAGGLSQRNPSLMKDLLEMVAFVNFRRIEVGEPAILCVSGHISGR